MAKSSKLSWAWAAIPIVIIVGYRTLTGSSLTRDIAKKVTTSSGNTSSMSKEQKEKKMWLDYYETGECQANLKRKAQDDAAINRMRRELGPDTDKILKSAFDIYCKCVSTSSADGANFAETINACKPLIESTMRKEAYGLGYDMYDH